MPPHFATRWKLRLERIAHAWGKWVTLLSTKRQATIRRDPEMRMPPLGPRKLEPRRVLNASIQSLIVPEVADEGDTVEVSAEATGDAPLRFDWTVTQDSTVVFSQSGDAPEDAQFSFIPLDDGEYEVNLTVSEQFPTASVTGPTSGNAALTIDPHTTSQSATLTVANVPPRIEHLAATPIDENGVTQLTGTIVDPGADDFTLEVHWGDPLSPSNAQTFLIRGGVSSPNYNASTGEFTLEHQYLDDNPTGTPLDRYEINVEIRDDDGGASTSVTRVEVTNVAPRIDDIAASPTTENSQTTLTGKIVDPGSRDTHTLTIDWGDPNSPGNEQTINLAGPLPSGVSYDAATGLFEITHQYLDNNASERYSVVVQVTDDDTGGASYFLPVQVTNQPPRIEDLAAKPTVEDGETTLTGKIVDPGTLDTHTLAINWGDPLSPGNMQTIDLTAPLPAGVSYDAATGMFSINHRYLDDNPTGTAVDSYEINVQVTDDDGAASSSVVRVQVANLPPRIENLGATNTTENGLTTLTGRIVDPGTLDTFALTIDWGDPLSPGNVQAIDLTAPLPAGVTYEAASGEFSVSHQYLDDNPTGTASDFYDINVQVTDDDTASSSSIVRVSVANLPPRIENLAATPTLENGLTTLTGKIVDPGTLDTFALTIDWGDPLSPGNEQTIDLAAPLPAGVTFDAATGVFSISHQYLDDSPTDSASDFYEIEVQVTDDDSASSSAITRVEITNIAPKLENLATVDIDENGVTTLSGSIIDPGTLDTFTLTVNWGDGAVEEFTYAAGTTTFSETHQYLDDQPGAAVDEYTIRLTLVDDDRGEVVDAATVGVANVDPVIDSIDDATIDEGQAMVLGIPIDMPLGPLTGGPTGAVRVANFSDVGTLDTHTASVDWGDGNSEPLSVVQQSGGGIAAGDHTYADNGVYTVTLTVVDDDGGLGTQTFTVTVLNVDPTLTGTDDLTLDEGEIFSLAGLGVGVSDPGFDNLLNLPELGAGGEMTEMFMGATIDWGDGNTTPLSVVDRDPGAPGVATTAVLDHAAHAYADNGTYEVQVTLRDDDGPNVTRNFEITVNNVAPELELTDEAFELLESDTLTLTSLGTFTDPGFNNLTNPNGATRETFSYEIDWGDGTATEVYLPVTTIPGSQGVLTTGDLTSLGAPISHVYADNDVDNTYTITVTLSDDDGGTATESFDITVLNVNPLLEPVSATDLESDAVTFLTLSFDDPGADEWTVLVDWGDKLDLPPEDRFVEVNVPDGATPPSTMILSHRYTGPPDPDNPAADILIRVKVRDDDFASGALSVVAAPPEGPGQIFAPTESGQSNQRFVLIDNPGIEDNAAVYDLTPELVEADFPAREDPPPPPPLIASAVTIGASQEGSGSAGDQSAASEKFFELRLLNAEGEMVEKVQLTDEAIENLSVIFARLPDGHYQIWFVQTENDSERLVLDFYIRAGRVVDALDDSEGSLDRPPTSEEVSPALDAPEAVFDGSDVESGERDSPRAATRNEGPASALAVAALVGAAPWRERVQQTLEQATERDWRRLAFRRLGSRRPR